MNRRPASSSPKVQIPVLPPLVSPVPGLFITATDTGVGKTMIASAIAAWFRREGSRVGVLKPVATGCVHRREGLVSEDAELLAVASDTHHPLDLICPNRYAEAVSPNVAADRAGQPMEWDAVARSLRIMTDDADVLVVEGAGGIAVPIDNHFTMLDLAAHLALPTIVVARATLGTINHTCLTVLALQHRGVRVAGVVVNNYPAETPGIAEETNPRQIEKWSELPVLCICPHEAVLPGKIPSGVQAAVDAVDWAAFAKLPARD